jgi:hypothetical protein
MLEPLVHLKGFIGEEKLGQRHEYHLKPTEEPIRTAFRLTFENRKVASRNLLVLLTTESFGLFGCSRKKREILDVFPF